MSVESSNSKQVSKQTIPSWSLSSFIYKTTYRLLWLTSFAGSVYFVGKYAQAKLKEYTDKMAIERTAKENLRRRFEQNQQDCSYTTLSLLPNLSEPLLNGLNVEAITKKLQHSRKEGTPTPISNEKSKRVLWEDVKLLSFTRTISAVYLVTFLTVLTHVQLNLMGRFIYLDSVQHIQKNRQPSISSQVKPKTGFSPETERKFLTLSWYLLNVGLKRCVDRVRHAVDQVIGKVSLKESTTYDSLLAYLDQIRAQVDYIDGDQSKLYNLMQYLLPPEGEEGESLREGASINDVNSNDHRYIVDAELKLLLDETRDFLESPDFCLALNASLDDAFNTLAIQLRSQFFPSQISNPNNDQRGEFNNATKNLHEENLYSHRKHESKVLPLAGVLPSVSRQAHLIINGKPNIYIQVLSRQPTLMAFSAIIYASFQDPGK